MHFLWETLIGNSLLRNLLRRTRAMRCGSRTVIVPLQLLVQPVLPQLRVGQLRGVEQELALLGLMCGILEELLVLDGQVVV